jgi:hypothetical protein
MKELNVCYRNKRQLIVTAIQLCYPGLAIAGQTESTDLPQDVIAGKPAESLSPTALPYSHGSTLLQESIHHTMTQVYGKLPP